MLFLNVKNRGGEHVGSMLWELAPAAAPIGPIEAERLSRYLQAVTAMCEMHAIYAEGLILTVRRSGLRTLVCSLDARASAWPKL